MLPKYKDKVGKGGIHVYMTKCYPLYKDNAGKGGVYMINK